MADPQLTTALLAAVAEEDLEKLDSLAAELGAENLPAVTNSAGKSLLVIAQEKKCAASEKWIRAQLERLDRLENERHLKSKFQSESYTADGQSAEKLVKKIDKDHDGEITYDEFKEGVRKTGKLNAAAMPERQIKATFKEMDADGDKAISKDELEQFVWDGPAPATIAEQKKKEAAEAKFKAEQAEQREREARAAARAAAQEKARHEQEEEMARHDAEVAAATEAAAAAAEAAAQAQEEAEAAAAAEATMASASFDKAMRQFEVSQRHPAHCFSAV